MRWRALIGVAVSGICLYLVARRLMWGQFWLCIKGVDLWHVMGAAAITTLTYALRGWRWRLFFEPAQAPTWWTSMRVLLIGYAANNVLPARAGELVRAHSLSLVTPLSSASAFATIVLERAFDAAMLCILFGCAMPLMASRTQHVGALVLLSTALLVAIILLYLLWRWKGSQRGAGLLAEFIGGLRALGSRHVLTSLASLSALIWLLDTVGFWVSLTAFRAVSVPWEAALAVTVFGNLGTMVPAAPSAVGTFELAVVEVLGPWGFAPTLAFSMAVLMHVTQFVVTTIPGFVCWAWLLTARPSKA